VAPLSYLFSITVTDVPVRRFGSNDRKGSRIYVDPTVPPEPFWTDTSTYITEHEAKRVQVV
jgi:hypothetical protein